MYYHLLIWQLDDLRRALRFAKQPGVGISNGQKPTLFGVRLYRRLARAMRQWSRKAQGLRLPADADRPRPNTRVTKGKLEGRHFAVWAKGEAKEAKSKDEGKLKGATAENSKGPLLILGATCGSWVIGPMMGWGSSTGPMNSLTQREGRPSPCRLHR